MCPPGASPWHHSAFDASAHPSTCDPTGPPEAVAQGLNALSATSLPSWDPLKRTDHIRSAEPLVPTDPPQDRGSSSARPDRRDPHATRGPDQSQGEASHEAK